MRYYLFIDESGDHGLTTIDSDFPVFLLSGVVISATDYDPISLSIDKMKSAFWGERKVILHSRDIRKCEKEFNILFDLDVKKRFYEHINDIISKGKFTIIASAIRKDKYIRGFGKLSDDVYELSLSFIIERAIFYLDNLKEDPIQLFVIIEKRGAEEDRKLGVHFQKLLARGTGYVSADRLKSYGINIHFRSKKENINGLQLADLVAYPIARYVIDPKRANPAFDLLKEKFYSKDGNRYGLKVYP